MLYTVWEWNYVWGWDNGLHAVHCMGMPPCCTLYGDGTMVPMLYTVWGWDNDLHGYLIVSVTVYLRGVSCSDMNFYYKELVSITRDKLNPAKNQEF